MRGRLKLRLMALFTFVNVAIGVTLGGLLYTIWPAHYFAWYPSIPFFYWFTGMMMTYFLDRAKKRRGGDVTVTTFMVVRFCKFTLALAFLWLYAALIGRQMKVFGFTMMLFYFIYLGLETYTIYLFEKKRMKRERKEKDGKEEK